MSKECEDNNYTKRASRSANTNVQRPWSVAFPVGFFAIKEPQRLESTTVAGALGNDQQFVATLELDTSSRTIVAACHPRLRQRDIRKIANDYLQWLRAEACKGNDAYRKALSPLLGKVTDHGYPKLIAQPRRLGGKSSTIRELAVFVIIAAAI